MEKVGIIGYGTYVPIHRVDSLKIAEARERGRKDLKDFISKVRDGLLLRYKAIADPNEDVTTLATEAAENALRMSQVDPKLIGSIVVGSESFPYAVGSTSRHVGSFVGVGNETFVSDIEGACNAGLQAVDFVKAQISSGEIKYGLAIGSDIAQAPKGDPLEYATGSGAAAFLLGREKESIVKIIDMVPFSSLYMDFWRREGSPVPRHFGKSSVDSYIRHIIGAISNLLKRYRKLSLSEFDYITFHQPSGYMPLKTCRTLLNPQETYVADADLRERIQITQDDIQKKVMPWLKVMDIGNTYSAATMIGISSILEHAKPDENILAVSYGSGAYTIAMWLQPKKSLLKQRKSIPGIDNYIDRRWEISLSEYDKYSQYHLARETHNLSYPKLIGKIKSTSKSNINIQLCKGCKRIYYPPRDKCLEWECKGELVAYSFPLTGKLQEFKQLPFLTRRRLSNYDILHDGNILLVECELNQLKKGIKLEAVLRRITYEGIDGLIQYGVCYRPLFRTNYPGYKK